MTDREWLRKHPKECSLEAVLRINGTGAIRGAGQKRAGEQSKEDRIMEFSICVGCGAITRGPVCGTCYRIYMRVGKLVEARAKSGPASEVKAKGVEKN